MSSSDFVKPMHRVDRTRKSAKGVVKDYADELLKRDHDPDRKAKLLALETIALRMNWTDLYNRLRFKSALHKEETVEEKWFQR